MLKDQQRRFLVTGAGTGIGRAITERLFSGGCDVALLGRREGPLRRLAARADLWQRTALVVPADLADRPATDRALGGLLETWPILDGAVFNAGINDLAFLDAPETRAFDSVVEVNLTSILRVLGKIVPALRDGGRIVVIGSILGRFGIPNGHGYCASKAGVMGIVRALALDVASRGITVNAVLPGWTETEMAAQSIDRQAPLMNLAPEAARAMFTKAVPIGRFLDPREIARTVEFLVARDAGGITGQAINVCGGVMA